MKTLLITGAGGNVGIEVLRGLRETGTPHRVIVGGRRPEQSPNIPDGLSGLESRKLDFEDPATFPAALDQVDRVFLLRPPHLADVKKTFEPFLDAMKAAGTSEVVFLSVQGAEDQPRIPHHKIEALIREKGADHVFLRPSYFMQNLVTTLAGEIRSRDTIFIPAGKLKFTWIDVRDIGRVGAHVLNDFDSFRNTSLEITGSEQMDFEEVAGQLSGVLGRKITYESPGLLKFFIIKRRQGMSPAMIFVMVMLHYLPRFSRRSFELTGTVKEVTGSPPGTLREFLEREASRFE